MESICAGKSILASEIASIRELKLLHKDSFYVTVDGVIVNWEDIEHGVNFRVHFRLRGGKGGFGSLLRSFRIHRSTNQLMCRDLSGRRLADIKEEERLRNWIAKAGERAEISRKRKREKYDKLKSRGKKHELNDVEYIRQREEILEKTDDAFDVGLALIEKTCSKEDEMVSSVKAVKNNEIDVAKLLNGGKRKIEENDSDSNEIERKICKVIDGNNQNVDGQTSIVLPSETEVKPSNDVKAVRKTACNYVAVGKTAVAGPEYVPIDFVVINLNDYENVGALQALGMDQLKHALIARGMKCGGTLLERAMRLFSVKDLDPQDYPKSVRATSAAKS